MFTVHRASVRDGLDLAFIREGVGGYPLLLVHGYPETKRIWWRNIEPLARAGFEVIVPDLRGYGDSDLAPDEFYDPAAFATDLHVLVREVLGHQECAAAGGDLGGVVIQELSLRFAPFVSRQCLFNTVVPELGDLYREAGVPPDPDRSMRPTADYFLRQGKDAEGLIAELDTPERRRSYIADFYGHRLWAARGTFSPADIDFMTEPFADADHLRASWGAYEVACGARRLSDVPHLFETSSVPTLVLYGPDDHVVWPNFPQKCAVAFTECIGPFVVPGAGHFLQWEQSGVLNNALRYFFGDLSSRGISQD
jgi:pimeloyl-ACP methyl ester carboxylesterase